MSINLNGSRRVPSLSREQLAVLGAIAKQPRGTRITGKLIANELGISVDAAHTRIARMKRAGLLKRGGLELA